MKIEKYFRLIIIIVTLSTFKFVSYAQKVGTTSMQFLKVMPTARATAMGEAYVSLASGADGVFWNPATLALAANHEISTTLTLWLFDTRQSAISYALPIGTIGNFGIQMQYVDFGTIEETRYDHLMFVGTGDDRYYNPGLTGRTFSPYSYLIGLSYAKYLTDRFSTGISVKYASEILWSEKTVTILDEYDKEETYNTYANVFIFDFGIHYNTGFRSIKLGASVQNFGKQVKFGKESYLAPLVFRLGATANVIGENAVFINNDKNRLTLAYDILQPNDYQQQMHYGLEYSYSEWFALRAGYKWNYDNDGLTFGGGVKTEFSNYQFLFDYSYGDMGKYLKQVHRLSLGVIIK